MPKSQTKRAIQARKWRVSARGKRRFNTIVTEYVRLKHKEIYEECSNLYESIVENYSPNLNLTKTKEFRELLGDYIQSDEVGELHVSSGEEDEPGIANNVVETAAEENIIEPTVANIETAAEENIIQPAVQDEVLSIGDTYVEPGLIMNNYIVEPQADVLAEVINDTIGDINEYENINGMRDIDAIVNEIVNDLEDVEPHIFAQPTAEDEGIGLNFEDEADYEPYDFDIDMDLYDFDFDAF